MRKARLFWYVLMSFSLHFFLQCFFKQTLILLLFCVVRVKFILMEFINLIPKINVCDMFINVI